ncbi:MAG TPA: transcription antitermination factor NusB [Burkholderiales bacterium]|jgi:N utilization substance protein B|nr:transcription antitermination factor NusB [Burkholderiales bacterium]
MNAVRDAAARTAAPARSARRRAREFALQGIYQWQLAGNEPGAIIQHLSEVEGFGKADAKYFTGLVRETVAHAHDLDQTLAPLLDRTLAELSPVEHAVLLIAAFEFAHRPEVPYRVVINEAVELAKTYGGADGHKYVNGVLDRLAAQLRPVETGAR